MRKKIKADDKRCNNLIAFDRETYLTNVMESMIREVDELNYFMKENNMYDKILLNQLKLLHIVLGKIVIMLLDIEER